MRRLLTMLMFCASPASAHDFWIDLPHYQVSVGAVPIRFLIGDAGKAEAWDTQWRKVVALRSYGPAGVRDQQAGIKTGEEAGGATLTLSESGTHVVTLESTASESDISAAEFNAYATHEGLVPALQARARDGRSETRGRELYARRAKALVQIGTTPTANATKAIGLTLEITPLQNPYAQPPGAPLVLRVNWHGRPLAGASVALEGLDSGPRAGVAVLTDARGEAQFSMPGPGRWRATTVWTEAIAQPRADWDTYFASLTFGN